MGKFKSIIYLFVYNLSYVASSSYPSPKEKDGAAVTISTYDLALQHGKKPDKCTKVDMLNYKSRLK
jgi:hypothetical protein